MDPQRSYTSIDWAGYLHPSRLATMDDVNNVAEQYNARLTKDNCTRALECLIAQNTKYLVETIISVTGRELRTWLFDYASYSRIVSTAKFSESVTSKLLIQFSSFETITPIPLNSDAIFAIREFQPVVRYAPAILDGLFALTSVDEYDERSGSASSLYTDFKAKIRRLGESIEARLREIIGSKEEAFKILELDVPTTLEEVKTVAETLLKKLMNIFEFYTSIFRLLELNEAMKRSILAGNLPESGAGDGIGNTDHRDGYLAPNSAFPSIMPQRSALYFDSAKGFGEWRILISSRADADLRRCSKKERPIFKIIVNKLKDLSRGHFSASNQILIAKAKDGIPIFKAKMDGDTRLLYHVDLIEEDGSLIQVLKIFGAYTHAQIYNTNWEAISRQLGHRGKIYRRMCTVRCKLRGGIDTYSPAFEMGSLETVGDDDSTEDILPLLSPAEMEQLHALIGQEKFVAFSKQLLFNMLANLDDEFPFLLSSKEKEVVDHPHSCYVLGRSGTGKTITILYKMLSIERIHSSYSDDILKPRQVFVTQSRTLVKKVKDRFVKLYGALESTSYSPEELKQLLQSRKVDTNDPEAQLSNPDGWPSDLPQRLSELEDQHFPLFIAYDHLCAMIERDFMAVEDENHRRVISFQNAGKLIDYDRFLREYWGHFPTSLTNFLDPAVAYSEILGVISGCEATLSTTKVYLDKEAYTNVDKVDFKREAALYDLFLIYLKKKRILGDFDKAQRTHALLACLCDPDISHALKQKFDYIYVDEVQDHLMIETCLLRSLCINPNGMLWAGDTAQTISRGSSFSFNELKAFLYRIEERLQKDQKWNFRVQSPDVFQLTVNYRSHSGIVNAASTIVEIISRIWPGSLDVMERERGITPGLKPVFFTQPSDATDNAFDKYLFQSSGKQIAFGSEQCILVRNSNARKNLEERIGRPGLIFTIEESKGLEFNDVLLYNFFHDSDTKERQWKVTLDSILNHKSPANPKGQPLGLCIELKFLYVGITRARNKLWIADCSLASEPMRQFWSNRNEIETSDPETTFIIGQASTPDQWRVRGDDLFYKRLYLHAKQCYENAGRPHAAAIAHAYSLRENAYQSLNLTIPVQAKWDLFTKAAEALLICTHNPALGDRKIYLAKAAECFEKGCKEVEAVQNFVLAGNYDDAIRLSLKLGNFSEAFKMFLHHESQIHPERRIQYKERLRAHYFELRNFKSLERLFGSVDEQLKHFLNDKTGGRLDLLLYHRRFAEAACLHLALAEPLKAIDLYFAGGSYSTAREVILKELWQSISFQENLGYANIGELFKRDGLLDRGCYLKSELDELKVLKDIFLPQSRNVLYLLKYGEVFHRANRQVLALLCFHRYFMSMPTIRGLDMVGLHEDSDSFLAYITTIRNFLSKKVLASDLSYLFGLRQSLDEPGKFVVTPTSVLYNACLYLSGLSASTKHRCVVISSQNLVSVTQTFLKKIALESVAAHHEECLNARILHPCFRHQPFEMTLCSNFHPESFNLGSWCTTWISYDLKQILLNSILEHVETLENLASRAFFWVENLMQVLHLCRFAFNLSWGISDDSELAIPVEVVIESIKGIIKAQKRSYKKPVEPKLQVTFVLSTLEFIARFGRPDEMEPISYELKSILDYCRPANPAHVLSPGEKPPSTFLPEYYHSGRGLFTILRGIDFLSVILGRMYFVDIHVLFSCLDRISALTLMAHYKSNGKGPYTGLLLPRSWLCVSDPNHRAVKTSNEDIPKLFELLKLFARQLCMPSEMGHLLYGTKAKSLQTEGDNSIRNSFITRLLISFSLLGLNLADQRLRGFVLDLFKDIRDRCQCDESSPDLQHLLKISNWDEVQGAVCSTNTSPFDEMIQVCWMHDSIPTSIPGVRLVVYSKSQYLRHSLEEPLEYTSYKADSDGSTGAIAPSAIAPRSTLAQVVDKELKATNDIPTEVAPPSRTQFSAVAVVEKYRMVTLDHRSHTRMASKSENTLTYQFHQCFKYVQRAGWSSMPYKIRFLGVLPHVLFVLFSTKETMYSEKITIKEQRTKESGEKLESLNTRQTMLTSSLKIVDKFIKQLGIDAPLHHSQDMPELMKQASKAIEALQTLRVEELQGLPTDATDSFHILTKSVVW